jgi:hypothetical protein
VKQLITLAAESGKLEECMSQRMLQFNSGRALTTSDKNSILKAKSMNSKAVGFKDFLIQFVQSPEFRNRKGL